MQNIEALTFGMLLMALGAGILAAQVLPLAQSLSASAASGYFALMALNPFTSAWFTDFFLVKLGVYEGVFDRTCEMAVVFSAAAILALVINMATGRIRGGLPPAV